MTKNWHDQLSPAAYSNFKEINISDDWFEVYQIAANLYVFYEPRHYERTIANLLIGPQKAILIDTGCGIGDLAKAVAQVTDKPVMVINTHTHPDHLGSNRQFEEIAMFDHPLSHQIAENGVSHQILQREILNENLVIKPWPPGFDPDIFEIPPFSVDYWLKQGDQFNAGGLELEVIHTPGEAADHICLLDKANRLLFCGDILLEGEVWTHLPGGSLKDLISSYQKLMGHIEDFDYLMPSHNQPWIYKDLLAEALTAAEKVFSEKSDYQEIIDPWNNQLKRHSFGKFAIITR